METDRKVIIVGFAATLLIFVILLSSGAYLLGDPMFREFSSYAIISRVILTNYSLPFSGKSATEAAEKGMLSLLDPFSGLISSSDFAHLREEASGQYAGIGISVLPRDTAVMVVSVRKDSPAEQAGLKGGDLIIRINDRAVSLIDPIAVTDLIRGPAGTEVVLTVYRRSIEDTLVARVIRREIPLEHIQYAGLDVKGSAYIRMSDFEAGAARELRRRVNDLEEQGAAGYIIDLTGNPGGYLEEAVEAASIFLSEGQLVVGTESHSRWEKREFKTSSPPSTDKPVVILTDAQTASAAEILAGALRGAGRGVIIGDTTFGKGLVQVVYSLPNQDGFRLTTSRYYFADGTYLTPPDTMLRFNGLSPDIAYRQSVEARFVRFLENNLLLYDFVDAEWVTLSSYPDNFDYPGEVVSKLRQFAREKGLKYVSGVTDLFSREVALQAVDLASPQMIDQLKRMVKLSQKADDDAFTRYESYLKFRLRRIVVERKHGAEIMFRDVVVPDRPDIRLAADIIADTTWYRNLVRKTDQ